MSYLEIMLLGWIINLSTFAIMYLLVFLLTLIESLADPFNTAKSVLIIENLNNRIKVKRNEVDVKDKYDLKSLALLFPFVYIFSAFKYLLIISKYGVFAWLIDILSEEIYRLESAES